MKIKPLHDNIVLQIEKIKDVETESGILIPVNKIVKQEIGTVVAVGEGRMLNDGSFIEPKVKLGDKVLFDKFAGTEIESENKLYLILKENHILAIL